MVDWIFTTKQFVCVMALTAIALYGPDWMTENPALILPMGFDAIQPLGKTNRETGRTVVLWVSTKT